MYEQLLGLGDPVFVAGYIISEVKFNIYQETIIHIFKVSKTISEYSNLWAIS